MQYRDLRRKVEGNGEPAIIIVLIICLTMRGQKEEGWGRDGREDNSKRLRGREGGLEGWMENRFIYF